MNLNDINYIIAKINHAINFYRYVKEKEPSFNFGTEDKKLDLKQISKYFNKRSITIMEMANFKVNFSIRPIDENNLILDVSSNYYIDEESEGNFKLSTEGNTDSVFRSIAVNSREIPVEFSKIKKIIASNKNHQYIKFYGSLINYNNLNFKSDVDILYRGVDSPNLNDFSGLNNCTIPKLKLNGCNNFRTINNLTRESVPIIELLETSPLYDFSGLRYETIFNEDGTMRFKNSYFTINFNSGNSNEYLDFIRQHRDVYDNPLKLHVFNLTYKKYREDINYESKSYLEVFDEELRSWGYYENNNLKNKLMGLLLK